MALELQRVNQQFQLSVEGNQQTKQLKLIIADFNNMQYQYRQQTIQLQFNLEIYDMLCVCWGSNQYQLNDFPSFIHQDIHWCQIHESKLFCEILVFVL